MRTNWCEWDADAVLRIRSAMAHEAWSPSSPLEAQIAMSQEVLDGLVSARMLKPKLLARPPFRYLHDLVMELLCNTGFAPGLYSLDEQDPAYYQQGEKEAKVSFLFKLMSVVSLVLQAPCPADPFKASAAAGIRVVS